MSTVAAVVRTAMLDVGSNRELGDIGSLATKPGGSETAAAAPPYLEAIEAATAVT